METNGGYSNPGRELPALLEAEASKTDDSLKRYQSVKREHLAEHGPLTGPLHLDGWKTSKRRQIMELYARGKVSIKLAVAMGAKYKDHLAMIESVPQDRLLAVLENLASEGVDLDRLQTVAKQMDTRKSRKADQAKAKSEQAERASNAITVKREGIGAVVLAKGNVNYQAPARPMTEGDQAVAEYDAARQVKALKDAKAEQGVSYSGDQIPADLLKEILAKNEADKIKAKIVIK